MLTTFGLIWTACLIRELERLWSMRFSKGQRPQQAIGRFARDRGWWMDYLANCAFLSLGTAILLFVVIGSISFAFFGGVGFQE